jgi:hypothetical protein
MGRQGGVHDSLSRPRCFEIEYGCWAARRVGAASPTTSGISICSSRLQSEEYTLDNTLPELRQTLDRLGYVVVPHGDHLCVRLPLLASVRIYSSNGRLRFVSRFGPFGRTSAVLGTGAVGVAAVAGALAFLGPPVALVAAFLGVAGLAHDGYRFVLTESCEARLQQLLIDRSPMGSFEGRRLTASPPRQIGGEHGVDVGAKPGSRVPVPIDGPGDE